MSGGASASRSHEYSLDNGLKLIVQEDHRAPVAVIQIWYSVGSSYEYDGTTGVSHALEHMMFKGTSSMKPGEFSEIVASHGGRENAFTSSDYTAYFQQWAADNVELSFELEAERMQNLLLDETEFKKEIRVVLEERRLRTDDDPKALAAEALRSVAYQTSTYRQPVIGWASDIQNMELDDLADWYRRWYSPNHATVVVVGDVEPEKVYELAKKHFGPIPVRDAPPTKPRPEVPQYGTKRIEFRSNKARVPFLIMGYKAPVLLDTIAADADVAGWEIYALDVLAETLDGSESARLPRKLVRGDEIASQVSASYSSTARMETLFSFRATPRPGTDLPVLEKAIIDEIAALVETPPTAAELERIKTQVVAANIYERDSMFFQGMIIGTLESVGLDWRLKDEYVENISAVTPAQVQQVAEKYLTRDRLSVAYLYPGTEE
jgi:zinc protease